MEQSTQILQTRCCICGGGPAGIMLGYLLARAGIDVIVIEKWGDFLRDFRGDTIHPSTMEILDELGILQKFLALKPNETKTMRAFIGGKPIEMADFTHLNTKCPYIAFIPQSDFLNFISSEAKRYSSFRLLMNTGVTDIIEENGTVTGVRAKSGNDTLTINAELVIGADGRHSTIREKAGLRPIDSNATVDVLWFKAGRTVNAESAFYVDAGKVSIILNRGSYWQCGYIIKKGGFEKIKSEGIEAFRKNLSELIPPIADGVNEIDDWEKVKLLSVSINHLEKWYKPGLICIGDAAHAMSPAGGVGINLAIQDSVASANILVPAFKKGAPTENDLLRIQQRRNKPTRKTQQLQVIMTKNLIMRGLNTKGQMRVPWIIGLLSSLPFSKRLPGKVVGIGFRPEHIEFKI